MCVLHNFRSGTSRKESQLEKPIEKEDDGFYWDSIAPSSGNTLLKSYGCYQQLHHTFGSYTYFMKNMACLCYHRSYIVNRRQKKATTKGRFQKLGESSMVRAKFENLRAPVKNGMEATPKFFLRYFSPIFRVARCRKAKTR